MPNVSIKTIAEKAGVSPSTVSRVLNNYKKNFYLKPEIRERIMRCVEETGYKANSMFKSIRAKRTMQISVLTSSPTLRLGEVVNETLLHLKPLLLAKGYDLNYNLTDSSPNALPLPPWKVDGIIIPIVEEPERLALIEESGTPFLVLNGIVGSKGASVIPDEEANMRLAFEHLISLGHRRIAYGNHKRGDGHFSLKARYEAYFKLCGEFGMEPVPGHEFAREPLSTLRDMILPSGATALIAYDHLMSMKYLQAAWSVGAKVPEDISLIGFNDLEILRYAPPPFSCIDSDPPRLAQSCLELLMEQIEEGRPHEGLTAKLPGRIVARESTAKAKR